MQFLYKIPGYILLLFGGFCLSWGGFIIRSFEEATVWQILLLRSVFFMIALMIFLTATYKKNTIRIIKDVSEVIDGKEILCPASEEAGSRTTCLECGLCAGTQTKSKKSIAIVAHGAGKKHFAA